MKLHWIVLSFFTLHLSTQAQIGETEALAADKQALGAPTALARNHNEDPLADDKNALRALAKRYESAINQGNVSLLKDSVSPTASAVFMTGHELVGIDAMQKYYDEIKQQLGTGSSYSVTLHPDDTEFHGNIAIAHGTSEERVVFGNGKQLSYQSKWTAVLEKKADQWIAIRMHVSIDPIDNPFITMKNRVTNWTYAGVAGLVSALLVWLILRRKKSSRALA